MNLLQDVHVTTLSYPRQPNRVKPLANGHSRAKYPNNPRFPLPECEHELGFRVRAATAQYMISARTTHSHSKLAIEFQNFRGKDVCPLSRISTSSSQILCLESRPKPILCFDFSPPTPARDAVFHQNDSSDAWESTPTNRSYWTVHAEFFFLIKHQPGLRN